MGLTKPRASQIYDLDYKQATRVITTTNIVLSGGAPNAVDGVNLSTNDRVLVVGQDDLAQNGIYFVQTLGTGSSGTWARSNDTNSTGELDAGTIVMVTEGNVYKDTQWKLTSDDPIIIGVTPLTWVINILSTVGGANTQVQYNNSGTLAGSSNFVFDGSNVSVTGNIVGNYFLGNGSQLTGLPATYSNSNVQTYLPTYSGNIGALTVTGNLAVTGTTTTGLIDSNIIPTSNVTYSLGNSTNRWTDVWLSNSTIYLGNVVISATNTGLTVDGANVLTGNAGSTFSTSGNVVGGNVVTDGYVSATGNISGSYILGNGSQLTGLPESYSNANVSGFLAAFGSNTISTTGNITSGNVLTSGSGGDISGSGNIIGGNILTSGQMSSGGNILAPGIVNNYTAITLDPGYPGYITFYTGGTSRVTINDSGNITGGVISVTGNITGANIIGNGSGLTSLTGANVTGIVANATYATSSGTADSATTAGTVTTNAQPNITSVGVLTNLSSSGNIVGGNINTDGNVSGNWILPTTGLSTGGNVLVGGYVSVVGNLYVANIVSSQTLTVDDPLLYLTANVPYPYNYDIGFYSAFVGGTGNTYQHSGLVRDYTDNTWKLVSNIPEPEGSAFDFGPAIYDSVKTGNILAVGIISATGTVTSASVVGGVIAGTSTSVTGNIIGGNISTTGPGGDISGSGNIIGGNILTGGLISVTGNITGSYLIGNGSQLTGLPAGYSNTDAASFLASFGSNTISTTGNITADYFIGNGSTLTSLTGANVTGIVANATYAVSASSATTAGTVTTNAQPNITSVGTLTSLSSSGNITGSYLIGDGSQITGLPASGLKWTTVANAAPSSPAPGDFWYNSYTGIKYQYTNDGTSNVWVDQSYPTSFSTLAVSGNITSGNVSATLYTGANVSVTGTVTGNTVTATSLIGTVYTNSINNSGSNATGNIGSSSSYFNTVFAKATSAQYADLAEMYVADQDYPSGTVVEFGGEFEITASTQTHTTRIAGVVSTDPSYLMNSAQEGNHVLPIALTGRVPCRVVGTIRKGDRLVASPFAGVATALDKSLYEPGCIIGKALEDYNSIADGIIEIAVGRY